MALEFNQCVTVIPTCIDASLYTEKNYTAQTDVGVPIVGWIGSRGNVPMLSTCASALRQVASQRKFELRVITSDKAALREIDLDGVNVRWVDIDQADTVTQLQQLDVGIMPLPEDDPWMQYKCNAKMIQYMAVGVPAIGSDIGFNRELVQHEVNSLLATGHQQWVTSLNALLDSTDLRQRLGRAARKTVLESFTAQGHVEEYERAILGAKYNPQKRTWHHQLS